MPIIGEEEVEAVSNVLRKGPLTNSLGIGPKVTAFESKFAKFVDAKYAVAVNLLAGFKMRVWKMRGTMIQCN